MVDDEVHNCKKTGEKGCLGGAQILVQNINKSGPLMHALFLIPTALDFFSLLQGAHKPLDMERNPAHGALD